MSRNRVGLQDSIVDAIVKMSEGNPGAVRVLAELTKMEDGLGFIHYLKMDDYGIYGSRIWMCYKDLCGEDMDKLYGLLRNNKLQDAIKDKCNQDEMFRKEWEYEMSFRETMQYVPLVDVRDE